LKQNDKEREIKDDKEFEDLNGGEQVKLDVDKLDKTALKDLAKSLVEENCELQDENEKLTAKFEHAEKLAKKAADLNTMYNNLLKDFENYKHRNAKIKEQAKDDGIILAAEKIIPIYDNLLRAVDNMNDKDKEGIVVLAKSFGQVLIDMKVEKMEALNAEYDHNLHSAISVVKPISPEQENKIVKVISNGYIYKDKVIKHAQVIVAQSE